MTSKGRSQESLAGVLARRIRGPSSSRLKEDESFARRTEIHMEPVTPLYDESDPVGAPSDADSSSSQRVVVTIMDESLEVVAVSSSKLNPNSNHKQGKASPSRLRRPELTRARSAPKDKRQERDLSRMKELLKRTLSLGLQRHDSPTKLFEGVDVDNKSNLSTQPPTECGTKNESIECKAVDSINRSMSFTLSRSRSNSCPRSKSPLAELVEGLHFGALDSGAARDENASTELDLLNVLTFIEMDADEADWEETGVSAITAGSSSYYGDTTSSRRAVEGIQRAHCFKSSSLVDNCGTTVMEGDAKTNSDLFAFLEVSAIPNDIDQPSSRRTEPHVSALTSIPVELSAVEESMELTYEDAVIIESNKEAIRHGSIPGHEALKIDDRTESVVEMELLIRGSRVSLDEAPSQITDVKSDLRLCTRSLCCKANTHEDRDAGLGDEYLLSEFVEVVHTDGTTNIAPHDFQTSKTVVVAPETLSRTKLQALEAPRPSLVEGTDSYKKGTATSVIEIKDAIAGLSTATCMANPTRLEIEKWDSRSESERCLQRNDECTEGSVDYFDVPLGSFKLSPTGKVLDTEGSTFDDDSELAVIGKVLQRASPIATLGSSSHTDTLLEEFAAAATMQPSLTVQFQSDSLEGEYAGTLHSTTHEACSHRVMESKPTEPVVDSVLEQCVANGFLHAIRDPDTVVEDIRKSLAVNGDTALRILSLQLHKSTRSKTGPILDGNAAFTSFSREALVDNDDASADDELTQNQKSRPLIARTHLDDAFVFSANVDVGDVTEWIEPECEHTFDNTCASETVEQEATALVNPKQRDHRLAGKEKRSSGEEKKDDENRPALDSVPFSTPMTKVGGGSFYETTKKAVGYGKRPLYDEELTWGFLHGMMSSGVTLLHLKSTQAAFESKSGAWGERAVTMVVEPGSRRTPSVPRLEWTTIEVNPMTLHQTSSIGLLDIHSIRVTGDDGSEVNSENTFYVATREVGVHVFQAGSSYDRDMFVIGVQNLVAWLCFHLATGDVTASTMLYSDSGDPVFDTKAKAAGKHPVPHRLRQMNHLTHLLLD
jgi:hypothetical protein